MSDLSDSTTAMPAVHPAPEPEAVERRPGLAAELREILHDLRQYRDLLYQLTLRDVRIRYKQAIMGFGWALFMPALIVLSGLLVRLVMAHVSGRPLETASVAGIIVKAIPWGFFVSAIGFATSSLTGNSVLVTRIYFPRELLPISAVLAATFDALIGSAAVAVVLPFLGAKLSVGLLWVPVIGLLLFVFTIATSLFLSCANLFFRDVKYLVQVLLTFGVFFTPVFFDAAMFGPVAGRIAMLNPVAPLLEGLRLAVVEGQNLLVPADVAVHGTTVLAWSPWYLAYSALWAVGGLLASAVLFHRAEFLFAEYV